MNKEVKNLVKGATSVEPLPKTQPPIPKILATESPVVGTLGNPDEAIITRYIKELDKRDLPSMKQAIIGLTLSNTCISGWPPKTILTKMREFESQHKNRTNVLKYLEDASNACGFVGIANAVFDESKHFRLNVTTVKYDKSRKIPI